jgi:methylenetetrahydrofolate dehydrogenase (NAD+)
VSVSLVRKLKSVDRARSIRHISPSTLRPIPASHLPTSTVNTNATEDPAPPGTVKSILPCTPLAIVKVLEFVGVYNKLLEWGDRARGKVITVINRSEVVGRPLAALLANDGARVLSVDIDCKFPQRALILFLRDLG